MFLAYPVYSGRSSGGLGALRDIDRYGPFMGVIFAFVLILLVTSYVRWHRRVDRWTKRQRARRYHEVDDVPPSTDVEPLEVRVEGPPKSMVLLGDDDDQFRLRARPDVVLTLDDGTRGTLVEDTPLKCTFPGFSIVTNAQGRGSVGVLAGTTFYVVAKRSLPPQRNGDAHPFREAAVGTVPLEPVGGRYECRLEPKKPERRRIAKLIPTIDPTHRPRFKPFLYPGIPIAMLVTGWQLISPGILLVILPIFVVLLATIEDAAMKAAGED